MKRYIEFDQTNGLQISSKMSLEKPEGNWHVAPKDHDPAKIYILDAGKIRVAKQVELEKSILDMQRPTALSMVENAAEQQRQKFITPGDGKSMVYAKKEAEARRVLAGESGPFILLDAEAEALGTTVDAIAAQIVEKADNWLKIAAFIEVTTIKAKTAIQNATTLKQLDQAVQIDWSLPSSITGQ